MLFRQHPFFPIFQNLILSIKGAGPVYDLGTSKRFAKEMALVRGMVNENEYWAGGYNPNFDLEDACDFHCDVHDLTNLESNSAGGIVCLSVLEHVVNPPLALEAFRRVLKDDGVLIASVPFFIGYHGKSNNLNLDKNEALKINSSHETYSDFWRYTHEGLVLMFSNAGFKHVEIYPIDGPVICRLELLGLYRLLIKIPFCRELIHKIDRPKLGKITTMHFIKAVK